MPIYPVALRQRNTVLKLQYIPQPHHAPSFGDTSIFI